MGIDKEERSFREEEVICQHENQAMSQKIFDNVEVLAQELINSFEELKVIVIDGIDGSGKSFLATELASRLNAVHLDLDTFLDREKGGFKDYLRYEELKRTYEKSLGKNTIIIIEGVCVIEVMERLYLKPDVRIYVKRLMAGGMWFDGKFLDLGNNADEVIKIEEERIREFSSMFNDKADTTNDVVLSGLRKEIIRYHFGHLPHLKADYLFQRYE